MVYFDWPRRRHTRPRCEARLSDGLVDGQQGVQGGRVRVAGQRHLTEYCRQLTEEDASAGMAILHLVDKHRFVRLHNHITTHSTTHPNYNSKLRLYYSAL